MLGLGFNYTLRLRMVLVWAGESGLVFFSCKNVFVLLLPIIHRSQHRKDKETP